MKSVEEEVGSNKLKNGSDWKLQERGETRRSVEVWDWKCWRKGRDIKEGGENLLKKGGGESWRTNWIEKGGDMTFCRSVGVQMLKKIQSTEDKGVLIV